MLTVYGIETLQKRQGCVRPFGKVATVLTVYGIETFRIGVDPVFVQELLQQCLPFTVLKRLEFRFFPVQKEAVATVLTVYGIETRRTHGM